MHSYQIQVHNNHELENTNTLLMSLNENPIHSQSTVPLEDQEPSSIRHLTVKLRRTVSIAAANVAESIAPGQGEMLLRLANLDNINKQRISNAKNTQLPLYIEEKIPKIRQHLDPTKHDYFLSWIIETNLRISIPWEKAQQSQIVHLYKEHCSEVGIGSMSDRTIYTILETIHASEQKFVSGIDEFVNAASEGWGLLQQIIQKLPIQRQNKHDMSIMLENNIIIMLQSPDSHDLVLSDESWAAEPLGLERLKPPLKTNWGGSDI
ncbi:unnamed protein product [Rotaria magnacalcarata]|uniref:Uncharacterized protein n=2 Tax=Rotaria magnacalcarata TaxID=392030 RepID=A0A817ABG0_9BILA|nr:unnamed protein product [Rotaria magnacalcarata]